MYLLKIPGDLKDIRLCMEYIRNKILKLVQKFNENPIELTNGSGKKKKKKTPYIILRVYVSELCTIYDIYIFYSLAVHYYSKYVIRFMYIYCYIACNIEKQKLH